MVQHSPVAGARPGAASPTPGKDLRERVLDYRSRTAPTTPQVTASRTADQMAADVGEQPLSGTVGPNGQNAPADIARVQRALVHKGAMNPTIATGYIGTQTLNDIRAFQLNKGLVVDGIINPGGPTEATLLGIGSNENWQMQKTTFGAPIQMAEFKNYKDEWNQRLHNPKYNTMTAKEALGPPTIRGVLRAIELGAPIASIRVKNPLQSKAIDLLGALAGIEAEQVQRAYLDYPQAKAKSETSKSKTPQTPMPSPAERTRTTQPTVQFDENTMRTIGNLLDGERQPLEKWNRDRYKNPPKNRR